MLFDGKRLGNIDYSKLEDPDDSKEWIKTCLCELAKYVVEMQVEDNKSKVYKTGTESSVTVSDVFKHVQYFIINYKSQLNGEDRYVFSCLNEKYHKDLKFHTSRKKAVNLNKFADGRHQLYRFKTIEPEESSEPEINNSNDLISEESSHEILSHYIKIWSNYIGSGRGSTLNEILLDFTNNPIPIPCGFYWECAGKTEDKFRFPVSICEEGEDSLDHFKEAYSTDADLRNLTKNLADNFKFNNTLVFVSIPAFCFDDTGSSPRLRTVISYALDCTAKKNIQEAAYVLFNDVVSIAINKLAVIERRYLREKEMRISQSGAIQGSLHKLKNIVTHPGRIIDKAKNDLERAYETMESAKNLHNEALEMVCIAAFEVELAQMTNEGRDELVKKIKKNATSQDTESYHKISDIIQLAIDKAGKISQRKLPVFGIESFNPSILGSLCKGTFLERFKEQENVILSTELSELFLNAIKHELCDSENNKIQVYQKYSEESFIMSIANRIKKENFDKLNSNNSDPIDDQRKISGLINFKKFLENSGLGELNFEVTNKFKESGFWFIVHIKFKSGLIINQSETTT